MVQVRCPQCGVLVEGIEGQEAVCGHCGFRAQLPKQAPRSITQPAPPAAPRAEPPAVPVAAPAGTHAAPATKTPPQLTGGGFVAVWGYILGLAALFTFFLAGYGLPFAFGGAAIVMSLIAVQHDRKDRRAMLGLVFGGIAIVAAIIWLVV